VRAIAFAKVKFVRSDLFEFLRFEVFRERASHISEDARAVERERER
jgi:hypothetical protein